MASYGWGDTLGHVDQWDHSLAELCCDGGEVAGEVEVRIHDDSMMAVNRYIRHVISLHSQVRSQMSRVGTFCKTLRRQLHGARLRRVEAPSD